jgi:hypothetical protein
LEVEAQYGKKYIEDRSNKQTKTMSYLRLGFLSAWVSGGRLLDIGYGDGEFVKLATQAGFDAYGYEVHGVDCGVREASLHEEWDIITAFDSLEHIPYLDKVRSSIRRSKYVFISIPWRPNTFPKCKEWKHYRPGEHMHYFSQKSLDIFIDKPILRCVALEDVIRRSNTNMPNIYTVIYGDKE